MRSRAPLVLFAFVFALLALALLHDRARSTDPPIPKGGRPRNVAVSSDGNTVLSSSMASNFLAQVTASGGLSYLDLQAPSWGVCFVDANHAVVTHPGAGYLTVLERIGTGDQFQKRTVLPQVAVPLYCTEIIPSPTSNCVLVANRGKAPPNAMEADAWRQAVYEVDWVNGSIVGDPFETEREPRALAVSPDGTRLFVGTVQGALGGPGITQDYLFAGQPTIFDGGSVVAYDLATRAAVLRFPVGSPVRGLAVWPPAGGPTPPGLGGRYRLYFTHVGDGAQSEAPSPVALSFPNIGTVTPGGRAIPNVISSIEFDAQNDPVAGSRQNTIFRHDPQGDPGAPATPQDPSLPAVVHEKLAVRWDEESPGVYAWELWVSNSASGTVSRASIDPADGRIVTNGTFDLLANGFDFPVVLSRTGSGSFTTAMATASNATTVFELIDQPIHIDVDKYPADPSRLFTSRPMGICYDPVSDEIIVATAGDHQLVRVSEVAADVFDTDHADLLPVELTQESPDFIDSVVLLPDERRFFTFGRGFDFRENTVVPGPRVNTVACVSCHVDGHLDGKVRFTVTEVRGHGANLATQGPMTRPVAVPSVFDVGRTEWIFFDGLITVRDDPGGDPGCNSIYCTDTGFFPDTDEFTNVVASPFSPFAAAGLSANQLWGRYYFQKMNCSRCHGGAPPGTFRRFNEDEQQPPGSQAQADGPLPLSLAWSVSGQENRFLHDPSQSFISSEHGPSSGIPHSLQGDDVSFRNMTDVGTRVEPAGQGQLIMFSGVNTPALAGAWDNAPYFHDGRFRTLESVLDSTWVDASNGRAAPLYMVSSAISDPPDNAFNSPDFAIAGASDPVPPNGLNPLHPFGTHAPSAPPGTQSVSSFLGGLTPPPGVNPRAAILDFLRAASSKTDLCPPLTIGNWLAYPAEGCQSITLSWTTPIPMSCKVAWGDYGQGFPFQVPDTPEGTAHSVTLSVQPFQRYQMKITLDGASSPAANMPVCRRVDEVIKSFKVQPCLDPLSGAPFAETPLVVGGNPSQAPVMLAINLPERADVSLRVYDVSGRLVRTLVDGPMKPGRRALFWRGDGDDGRRAPSGVYFVVLSTDRIQERRRLVLVR